MCAGLFSHGDSSLPRSACPGCFCNNCCQCRYLVLGLFFFFFWRGVISGVYAQIHIFKCFCPHKLRPWVLFYFSDINVVCANNSVRVTWRVNAELVPYAARLFLGNCMASQWKVLPSGEGEAQFNYTFSECKFTKMVLWPESCNFSSFHSLVCSNLITCLLSPPAEKGETHILSEWNELQATGKAKPSRFCASHWMCLQKVCDPSIFFLKLKLYEMWKLAILKCLFFLISDPRTGFPDSWTLDTGFPRVTAGWSSTWRSSMVTSHYAKLQAHVQMHTT